ncbi:alpha/beta fold hydrolase [Nocardia stercoris]|uniref:Alpha/beta hydrolase n=1 Tax=Nocardia stercoris TaxID=2483361 RepID=A0A3M2KV30_9NOCA|nr:alpha/beta hydrolase [Nocardia stercoris]RMI29482.1 alpha/beta hydrolase [Nocardia stercoris]
MTNSQPTLVFIPCFSGAPWSADQLAPYGDLPARTLRLPEGISDMEEYADHVAAAVADLDDYVLVGDSFGANVALALAVRQPAGLRALVMSGGFAANPVSAPWKVLMRGMRNLRGPIYRQLVLRVHAHRLTSPFDGEGQTPWTAADSRKLFLDNTPDTSFGARVAAVLHADYIAALPRVQVPTLILTPEHDELVGADAAAIMRTGIPDSREVVLPRTGHMFRFSHPATYAGVVQTFLTETLTDAMPGDAAR